jgi:hypothetical protein
MKNRLCELSGFGVGFLNGAKSGPSSCCPTPNGLETVQWLLGRGRAQACAFNPLCPSRSNLVMWHGLHNDMGTLS